MALLPLLPLVAGAALLTAPVAAAPVPRAPAEGGPRAWQVREDVSVLELRRTPSRLAPLVDRQPAGALLSNLGCQRAEGRIWCDVQRLEGGRRGFAAAEFLQPAVGPDGSVPRGPDTSARRAGQGRFDATGELPCARSQEQPMGRCSFGVARAGGGYATVVVRWGEGRSRALYFSLGRPIAADTGQADGYPPLRALAWGDRHLITVGQERYEVPAAVVLGG